MSEATADRAYASPEGERQRISAASFRNLTARLKKADAAAPIIPDLLPDFIPDTLAKSTDIPPIADIVPPIAPQPLPTPHADPVPVPRIQRRTQDSAFNPFSNPAGHFDLPEFVPLEPPPAIPPAPVFEPVRETDPEPLSPPWFEAEPELAPAVAGLQPEPDPEPAPGRETFVEPLVEPMAEPTAEPEVLAQPVELAAPELPEAVEELPQQIDPEPQPEPVTAEVEEISAATELEEEAGVEEEPQVTQGHVRPTPADNAHDAADKEHLTSKEALELEHVWRSLLANPTLDERAEFVREMASAMALASLQMPEPAPEHDLSKIVPADVSGEAGPEANEATADVEVAKGQSPIVTDLSAASTSQSDHAEVARSLLDMMAAGSKSGLPHERALAADTLLRLVPKLDIKPLIMMSQRLAKADNPPNLLIAKLIRDPRVEVAGPLLEDCPQITDKDLEMVVSEGNSAKLRMLARRRHLTVAISYALIKTRDPSVMLTLVRNMEASISQEGFQALIQAAEDEKELLAPLCTRPDLPAPLAFELFWLAPPQLRRFILSRFLTDSETLTKILKITMSTNDSDDHPDVNNQHMLLEALERAARGKLEIAADELAQVLQITPSTALRILSDAEGEPLVVMLKVAGYPRQALTGLMKRFRDADLPLLSSGRELDELQSIFDTLSFNKARILLTYWDWAQRKTGPYAPLH
jgi:uncharacterized protein (DUF2336 family)